MVGASPAGRRDPGSDGDMTVGSMNDRRAPTLSPASVKLAGIVVLALMAPAATFARNVFGQVGVAALAVVLATGALLLLFRAATAGDLPRRCFEVVLGAAPLLAVYTVSGLLNPSMDAVGNVGQLVLVVGFV